MGYEELIAKFQAIQDKYAIVLKTINLPFLLEYQISYLQFNLEQMKGELETLLNTIKFPGQSEDKDEAKQGEQSCAESSNLQMLVAEIEPYIKLSEIFTRRLQKYYQPRAKQDSHQLQLELKKQQANVQQPYEKNQYTNLSRELICSVSKFLCVDEIVNAGQVNKHWRNVLNNKVFEAGYIPLKSKWLATRGGYQITFFDNKKPRTLVKLREKIIKKTPHLKKQLDPIVIEKISNIIHFPIKYRNKIYGFAMFIFAIGIFLIIAGIFLDRHKTSRNLMISGSVVAVAGLIIPIWNRSAPICGKAIEKKVRESHARIRSNSEQPSTVPNLIIERDIELGLIETSFETLEYKY